MKKKLVLMEAAIYGKKHKMQQLLEKMCSIKSLELSFWRWH